jgi:uncharacterized membrane protein YoaK (UPF0700 family)
MSDPSPLGVPEAERSRLFPIALALTAGFADAFGYLKLHGLLTAHITGNLAFMAVGLAQGNPHVIMKFLALPLFMVGVSLATRIITWIGHRSHRLLTWSLLLEAGLFLVVLLAGLALPPCRSTDDLTGFCVGTLLIVTMGTQNAIMRLLLKKLPSTTAMTNNVAEAVVQWTQWLMGFGRKPSSADKHELSERAKQVALTVSAFGAGAVAGALAATLLGYAGLVAPSAILAMLALRTALIHGQPGPTPAMSPTPPTL